MKKSRIIFFRVIFVLCAMLVATYFGFKFYFQFQSQQGIERALQTDNAPVIGNAENPFVLVEFFDYRCPHCSAFSNLVTEAVGSEIQQTTKILLRPTAVRDEESLKIAKLVLAADLQKKGETVSLHTQIMALSSIPTYDTVKAMAESKGIDVAKAEKDGEQFMSVITQNTQMLADIGFYGVPALVIGDKGYIPTTEMPGINELKLMMLDAKTRLNILK